MSGLSHFQRRFLRTAVKPSLGRLLILAGACLMTQCGSLQGDGDAANIVVSVKEQKLAVYDADGRLEQEYPISTSKYGLSDKPGKYGTPTGMLEVVAKIGHGAPPGAVFKNRRQTGEVIQPNAPGRDPIVSRIMWLRGLESGNKNAYGRCIYIHGTPEEKNIGRPASYGCIRMKSRDVIRVFNEVPIGSRVLITQAALPSHVAAPAAAPGPVPAATERPPLMLNPDQGGPSEPALPVVVAQNNDSQGTVRTVTQAANSGYQTRVTSDGSLMVAGNSGSPGMVLHSKRHAQN